MSIDNRESQHQGLDWRRESSWTGEKLGRWTGDDGASCGAMGPAGFFCTRDLGHPGRHVAAGRTAAYEAWPGTHEPDQQTDADPWTGSTALVGPLRRVAYWVGDSNIRLVERWYDLPKDSRDRRAASCFDHHPACDCREANTAEAFAEYHSELRESARVTSAARSALLIHGRSRSRSRSRGWYPDRCVTCHEPFPCPTRVILREALWPYQSREDYPL